VRSAVLLALLLAACASNAGSDGDECRELHCKCTAELGCDVGLKCAASVERCVPGDCEPGFEACVCSEGQCTPGFVCEGGLCVAGGATTLTSGPESTGPQTTGTATDPSASTSPTDDSGSMTMPTETADADATGPAESSSSNSGEPTCADERDCAACLACAIESEGPCADDHDACQESAQCMGLETCAANCAESGEGGQCVNQCCGLFSNGDMPPYSDLSACTNDACGDLCPDFAC